MNAMNSTVYYYVSFTYQRHYFRICFKERFLLSRQNLNDNITAAETLQNVCWQIQADNTITSVWLKHYREWKKACLGTRLTKQQHKQHSTAHSKVDYLMFSNWILNIGYLISLINLITY